MEIPSLVGSEVFKTCQFDFIGAFHRKEKKIRGEIMPRNVKGAMPSYYVLIKVDDMGVVEIVQKPSRINLHVMDFKVKDDYDEELCRCNGGEGKPHYHINYRRSQDGIYYAYNTIKSRN